MSGRSVTRRTLVVTAVVAAAGLVLSSCTTGTWLGLPPTTAPPTVDPGDPSLYGQSVLWEPCSEVALGAECATIQAPMDWAQPESGNTIDLAIARLPAREPDQRIGSLLLNPGGPGASGVEMLSYFRSLAGAPVRDAFDLVGFDPRGVGSSTAVVCYQTTEEMDQFFAATWPATLEGFEASRAVVEPFAQACAENTGPALAYIDTGSSARDMDLIRAVLGDSELYYLGYSYGTELGATYAELFPDKVGRLVLDGAVDPSLPAAAHDIAQAKGFQQALEAYVADCLQGGTCPLDGPVDQALTQINALLRQIDAQPLPGDSTRELTLPLAMNGLLVTMYDETAWSYLTDALEQAFAGDGGGLLGLSDWYLDRDDVNGYINNTMEAFVAYGCLDSRAPADPASVEAHAKDLAAAAPTFGEYWGFSEMLCEVWPYPQVGSPARVTAPGANPILVIGTTGDPATPYEWAQALADQLESGVLLTYEGHGHTAYGRSNQCIGDAVDAYLVEGTLPAVDTVC